MNLSGIDLAQHHFRQAKLRLRKAEETIAELMVSYWTDLTSLRKLFHAIPVCAVKKVIFDRIVVLEGK